MKTSVKWLKNYVDMPWAPAELAEKLTLAGLEVEGLIPVGQVPDGIVVAEILSRNPHPDADRLSVCEVSIGVEEPLQIVCGAPNCAAGAKVPLATIGTVMEEGFKIKKSKLRGVMSQGMLCSAGELNLSEDHAGLMILPQDAPVGAPLSDVLDTDMVIDWEVTPNRPDWLSHIGIAREVAAVNDSCASFRMPAVAVESVKDASINSLASVEVLDHELCPRYIARMVRNVTIAPSPEWMQTALAAVGIRSINNVVDITNYVLMECGQPLHAFDYDLIAGHKIIVRRAHDGEKLTTLDGGEHELTTENLLIADAEKGVALAGVMGGGNTEISDKTTTVFLESAVFQARNIRATARKLGLSSESSHRFERGVGLEMAEFASLRACALMCELAGGELVDGKIDAYPKPYVPHTVACRFARVNSLIGVVIDPDQVVSYFERLGLGVVSRDEMIVIVSVPSFRLDLEREVDLIEEVARLYGLDNINGEAGKVKAGGPMASDTYYPIEEARAQLLGLGLDETMTYSLVSLQTAVENTGVAENELIGLANPLSIETAYMRPTLLPGLLQTVGINVAHNNADIAFFELGRVLTKSPELPEERQQVGIVLSGHAHPERFGTEREREYDFFDMKGLVESWLELRRLTAFECRPASHPAFKQGVCAAIFSGKEQIAVFGEVCAELTHGIRLRHPLLLALVELDTLIATPVKPRKYQALPQFPAVVRDISLVAAASVTSQTIVDAIKAANCSWLEKVELFDVYEDEKALGPGKRSLAYSVTYRDPKKTLTDQKVNKAHEKIRASLAKALPVELR